MSNDNSNLEIWDKLRRVPPEHLKGFTRAGGFKGTAIKPMWSIHKMTEVFGPCGDGWGMDAPVFQLVPSGNELLVFCTVGVWADRINGAGPRVYGVGGDKVCVSGSNGPRNDDEAFKKAYTDALTNALKLLGAGADVHMGLWDGNKYINDEPSTGQKEPASEPMPSAQGDRTASKASKRSDYEAMTAAIRNAPTVKALADWYKNNITEIDKLPADWLDDLRVEYSDRQSELKKVLAA